MSPVLLVSLALIGMVAVAAAVVAALAVRGELQRARAEHSERLVEQIGALTRAVAGQLDSSHRALGMRLDETGQVVADVRERLGALGEATRRLERIGEGVGELRELLSVPKLRGTLGEVWLEQMLQAVFPPGMYQTQYSFPTGERVDAVVFIGQRLVPIDAKFPLEACQRLLRARGSDVSRRRAAFRRSLRARVDEIADKYIRPEYATFDFALMYVPAEAVYYEAMVRDDGNGVGAGVLEYAMRRRVIPVSPHTFYAYLSAVLYGLRGMRLDERAREIAGELDGLGQQFQRFGTAFGKVGMHLHHARRQFEECERHADRISERFERIAGAGMVPDREHERVSEAVSSGHAPHPEE